MLRNKRIGKKIRNIFILLMTVIIIVGLYRNIRNSRAENVIQVEMEVADKSNVLDAQTITVDATQTKDGNYIIELPKTVNNLITMKYYIDNENEVDMTDETIDKNIILTDDEITNKKIQLSTDYDKKDATTIDNTTTTTLYNKELTPQQPEDNNENTENTVEEDEVIVRGYMPLDAKLEVKYIDLATLTSVKLPNENQTMQKAYEISIYQEVAKQDEQTEDGQTTEEKTETTSEQVAQENEITANEQETEIEKVEYDPSVYDEKITIKTKNEQENTIATIYSLPDDITTVANVDVEQLIQTTETESIQDQEYVDFEIDKNDKTTKYMLATEQKTVEVNDDSIANEESSDDTENDISTQATGTNFLKTTINAEPGNTC